jgi:hypothetical protein
VPPGPETRSRVEHRRHEPTVRGAAGPDVPEQEDTFGLPTAPAMVIGSVIGTGVLAVRSAPAAHGPISRLPVGVQMYIWLGAGRHEYGRTPASRVGH